MKRQCDSVKVAILNAIDVRGHRTSSEKTGSLLLLHWKDELAFGMDVLRYLVSGTESFGPPHATPTLTVGSNPPEATITPSAVLI